MKIRDILQAIEIFAPPGLQEDYDNAGLITGDPSDEAKGAILSLDCTGDVVQEAIEQGCNLIIAHHPILFGSIKKLTPRTYVERTLISAIKNDIAIYACHTNLDNVHAGVNALICEKMGLVNSRILLPKTGLLQKLVTFVPGTHHASVLNALFEAGAGHINNYSHCSFIVEGEGTFKGGEGTTPFLGRPGELSHEKEIRLEVVLDSTARSRVVSALLGAHPYEEVAYDIYRLENPHPAIGSGMLAEFVEPLVEKQFLELVKKTFRSGMLRHTSLTGKKIKKVAVCGGSGRFLLKHAIGAGADAFMTADFKYHEFFDVEGKLLLADPGHFESEQFTPEIFYKIIREKFSTFAVHLSKINTNPVYYF